MRIPLWTTIQSAVPHNGTPLLPRAEVIQICLPIQLQAAVPACALDCLQVFIANNYYNHGCSVTANLNLLCATKTFSGLTIGEGALQCVVSDCSNANLETQSGYTVCDGVPGAQPEMAGTITATISAFTTLAPTGNESSSTASTSTESSVSSTSINIPTSVISLTSTTQSSTTTTSITSTSNSTSISTSSILPSPPSTSTTASLSSSSASTISGTTFSTSISSISSTTSTSEQPASTSVSHASTASSSSATAAAATEAPVKKQLDNSAVAGIATACVIIVGLIIFYLAYACFVKQRKQERRRSQRFSSFLPPAANHDQTEPPTTLGVIDTTQVAPFFTSDKRYYSAQNGTQNRQSFWRRSFNPYPTEIGVAVAASTRVSPVHRDGIGRPMRQRTSLLPPVSSLLQTAHGGAHRNGENRWSGVSSLDEDMEAQNQDLPALASPRTRSSSRSFSSAGIEKPLPLRLNTTNRGATQTNTRIPLTPTYDNGNYEPTIPQVLERPVGLPVIVRTIPGREETNFSMRQPSLRKRPGGQLRQAASQQPRTTRANPNPVRPASPVRKESTMTDKTTSIHTEFDEDSTPEDEVDKQLHIRPRQRNAARAPLRELQWPQVPRPAATSKQAQKTPSPRPVPSIRIVPATIARPPIQPWVHNTATETDSNSRSAITFNVSSSEATSENSISQIFPTPPPRNPLRLSNQPWLKRQISNAYISASQPTTMTTPTKHSAQHGRPTQNWYPPTQRLRTGRPLAKRLESQGYIPRPQVHYQYPLSQSIRPHKGATDRERYPPVNGLRQ